MVKSLRVAVTKLTLPLVFAGALIGQDTADFERRLQDLERKMRQLDPSFSPGEPTENLRQRLAALERRMDEVLAARSEKTPEPPSAPPASLPKFSGFTSPTLCKITTAARHASKFFISADPIFRF